MLCDVRYSPRLETIDCGGQCDYKAFGSDVKFEGASLIARRIVSLGRRWAVHVRVRIVGFAGKLYGHGYSTVRH